MAATVVDVPRLVRRRRVPGGERLAEHQPVVIRAVARLAEILIIVVVLSSYDRVGCLHFNLAAIRARKFSFGSSCRAFSSSAL